MTVSYNHGLLRAVTLSESPDGVRRRRPLSLSYDLDLRHPLGHARVPGLLSPRFPAHAQGRHALPGRRHPGWLAAEEELVLATGTQRCRAENPAPRAQG